MTDTPEIKRTSIEADIHPHLQNRFSPRAFADRSIGKATLHKIFEAARWAPSCSNAQPWRFVIGLKDDSSWQKILDVLDPGNQEWCQYAPVLMITIAKKSFPGKDTVNPYSWYDVGQAASHLTFQATEMGIYVHQMAGLDRNKANKVLELPDDHEAVSAIALGYLGSPEELSEKNRQAEASARSRNPLQEIVFIDNFGRPFRF